MDNFISTNAASILQARLFVFDLDGTLMDSSATIYNSTRATLQKLGYKYDFPKEEMDKRIGAHFQDVFDELGIVVNDIEGYLAVYKKIYFEHINDTTLYDGIPALLAALKEQDKKIALLTTKGQEQAERILSIFGIAQYFDMICGRYPGSLIKPAPEPLLAICENLTILPSETVMIGDTEFDVLCGKNAGTKTCCVTYGFRSQEHLASFQPDYLVAQPQDILCYLAESVRLV
ncbi:MAG: HAD family hydrolase [Ignavibacteria bacterium]|nr:HAD family hydrolase [Ignavibacteria bacterium]